MSISQRDVIIVFFNPKDLCNYNGHVYNHGHPQIGMQFGLTYAVETTAGDNKVYSIYEEHNVFESIRKIRREISIWNKSCTIIDDTPVNRENLESIYNALAILIHKINAITSTPDCLVEFINSKVKLLS